VPRCTCDGGKCSCLVLAGSGIDVSGSGSASNPYIISATQDLTSRIQVADTDSVDMHATGSGTDDDPLTISADVTLSLDDLTDVTAPTPSSGDTITWNGTQWVAGPPAVVPPGAVNVGAGLTGTGAVDSPIAAAVSGVWGVSPLDVYGDDSTAGLAIYVDSNGQLRAEPRVPVISYDDLTDVPATFPTTWDEVAGKPTSWPVLSSTTWMAVAAGWSIEWQNGYRTGSVATVSFSMRRTGAAIQAPATTGNITNTPLGTMHNTFRPQQYGPLVTASNGPLMTAYADSAGVMRLSAVPPGYRINTGDVLSWTGTWVCRGA
jgi:hypothetical protein